MSNHSDIDINDIVIVKDPDNSIKYFKLINPTRPSSIHPELTLIDIEHIKPMPLEDLETIIDFHNPVKYFIVLYPDYPNPNNFKETLIAGILIHPLFPVYLKEVIGLFDKKLVVSVLKRLLNDLDPWVE